MVTRSHSTAYASVSPASSLWSRMSLVMRTNARAMAATTGFLIFVVILSSDSSHNLTVGGVHTNLRSGIRNTFAHFGGAFNPGYFKIEDSIIDANTFHFASVSDLDQLSKVTDEKKPTFRSILLPGILMKNPASTEYSISFEPVRELRSQHNEAGRGMELSELTMYKNRLLAFDDRTGIIYELLSKDGGKDTHPVPRIVITEGQGDSDKGMKWEWASVKGNYLYLGSMGKEYTNPDGSVANSNNLWISIINSAGEVKREDWTDKFNFVREALGAARPGYLINEAILWSEKMQKWIFIPRRVSSEMYDENKDERKGSNKIVIVDDSFTSAKVIDIQFKEKDPLRGFSTFAFVPNSGDKHVLAIRSVEEDCVGGEEDVCKQRSYFSVFDITTGVVLMEEVQVNMPVKFEGVEFVNLYTKEPGYLADKS